MAENGLLGTPSVVQVGPEKPKGGPPSSEENRQTPSAEEPRPEKALVEALRVFIQHESGQPEAAPPKTIGPRQVIALVLFAVDAALIYSQLQTWLQNPLFQVALKVAPWVLGATAVGSADKVRRFMLEQARHMKWAIIATALLVPLLILQMPVFSLKVRVHSGSATVKPENNLVTTQAEGDRLFRLVFPRLDRYRITLEEPTYASKGSVPFQLDLRKSLILRGTLAQIPLVGRLFGPEETPLSPLYSVSTISTGIAYVEIEGQFQEGFFDKAFLNNLKCPEVKSTRKDCEDCRAVKCTVKEDGGFALPPGWYYLTLDQDKCRKPLPAREIKEGKNERIDFTELCK
jgi:hypothetical protein